MITPTYRSKLLSAARSLAPLVHFSGPADGPWTPPPGVQSQGAALPGVQSHSGVARDSWGAATRSSTSTITARARRIGLPRCGGGRSRFDACMAWYGMARYRYNIDIKLCTLVDTSSYFKYK